MATGLLALAYTGARVQPSTPAAAAVLWLQRFSWSTVRVLACVHTTAVLSEALQAPWGAIDSTTVLCELV